MLSGAGAGGGVIKPVLQKRNSGSWLAKGTIAQKYLWIRLALFERSLTAIIEHIAESHLWVLLLLQATNDSVPLHMVRSNRKYYEKDALVSDPEYGSLLGHLLGKLMLLMLFKKKNMLQSYFFLL